MPHDENSKDSTETTSARQKENPGISSTLSLNETLLQLETLVKARTTALEKANKDLATEMQARRSIEEAVSRSEARNKAILEAIPDMIFQISRHGEFIMAKADPNQLLYPLEKITGRNVAQILPPELAEKTMYAIKQVLGGGKPQVFEYQLALPGGIQFFEARLVAMGQDEVLVLVRNVSERIRLEQMKSDFIHRAAHELRTPIATITLMADLIQEGGSAEELSQYWAALKSELQRQRTLIEEILTMGRLESGKLSVTINDIDLSALLKESVRAVSQMAASRDIRIISSDLCIHYQILSDKNLLLQVFINLLDNAIKFSHVGAQIEIETKQLDGGVAVSIRDHGIGIPAADMPNLYSRFSRASNAVMAEIPGTGVGLYLVKSMLSNLGGKISAESTLGQGSVFTVWLPAA